MTKVEIEGGKYTICHENGAGLHALRHGDKWRDLCGDGMVLAMAQEIEDLRAELAALKAQDPVAWKVTNTVTGDELLCNYKPGGLMYDYQPLYAAPVVGAQPAGEVPEVVAYGYNGACHIYPNPDLTESEGVELMTIAQHTRIVAELQARAVVMPERKTKADYGVYINEFADEAAAFYNAALDEVARLNGGGGV